MSNEKQVETKTCKHCQSEIPKKAKVCPQCRKKQGGMLKWVIMALIVIGIIGSAAGGGSKGKKEEASNAPTVAEKEQKANSTPIEAEKEQEAEPIEYSPVTADELVDALDSNAMKAQNDYKDKYLEVSGKLGTMDSNGKYIDIDSNADFNFTSIQCYLKTDEHKEVLMNKTKGDPIVVRGYCKDVGEVLGYSIDIDSVE